MNLFTQIQTYTMSSTDPAKAFIKGYDDAKLLVSSASMAKSPNTQLYHALSGDTYVINFGEKLKRVTIQGIGVYTTCGDIKGNPQATLNKIYETHKLGSESPVDVVIAGSSAKCYLSGLNIEANTQTKNAFNFALTLIGN